VGPAPRTARPPWRTPAPTIAPVATCVVDTGIVYSDAARTSPAVTTALASPVSACISTTRSPSVRETRSPAAALPTVMASAVSAKAVAVPAPTVANASVPSAAIFGLSLTPRAKLIAAAAPQ
jgi:hypothetical protein